MKLIQSIISATEWRQRMLKQLRLNGKQTLCFFTFLLVLASGMDALAGQTGNAAQLTKTELNNLLPNAKTSADHQHLAQYFTAKAAKLEAEEQDYDQRAEQFKRNPGPDESKHPMSGRTYAGCRFIADKLHKEAMENQQLAAGQLGLATQAAD
jgi:hypothetical protein